MILMALMSNIEHPTRFYHSSESQFSPREIKNIIDKHGNNVVIGGDEGWDEDFDEVVRTVKRFGAKLHVYTVGPGMWEWSKEERQQIQSMARKHGLDTTKKNWFILWQAGVWKDEIFDNLKKYRHAYSMEIDNLDSVFSSPKKWIDFYIEIQEFRKTNNIQTRILIKNIDKETIKELTYALENSILSNDMFSVFAIFEEGTGRPKEQISSMAKLGIKAVTPINGLLPTHKYGTVRSGVPLH